MKRFIYQPSHLAFIETAYKKMGVSDVATAFNRHFNTVKTPGQIKAAIKNHKIRCGRKTGAINKGVLLLYSDEHIAFLRAQYKLNRVPELTHKINQKFGTAFKENQISACLKNRGITSGRTGFFKKGHTSWNAATKGLTGSNSGSFKKGQTAPNLRPIGSERINVDGYIEIKTADPGVWELKQRVEYARLVGEIPPHHCVRFRDGDRKNMEISNFILVDLRQNQMLNARYKVNDMPIDYRDTAYLMAKIDVKVSRLIESKER